MLERQVHLLDPLWRFYLPQVGKLSNHTDNTCKMLGGQGYIICYKVEKLFYSLLITSFYTFRELAMIREQEKAEKRAQVIKHSSRHSRFGGTFTVSNVQSISQRSLIVHSGPSKAVKTATNFDANKQPRKRPKNRRPITEDEMTRRSTLCIRIFLKEFCTQFLENCYNPLMYAVKVSGGLKIFYIEYNLTAK